MRRNTNQLLNSSSPDPNVQQSIRYEYIYLWEITLGTEVTCSTKQSYSLSLNPSWRNGNLWGKQTRPTVRLEKIILKVAISVVPHLTDKGEQDAETRPMPTMMRVEKTRQRPTMMRVEKTRQRPAMMRGKKTRQRPTMMRVEKNKAKDHYDEGGENKAKTHYNYEYEGREMRVWRKRKKTQKKDREWGKEPQSGQGHKGIGMIFSIDKHDFTLHIHKHTHQPQSQILESKITQHSIKTGEAQW